MSNPNYINALKKLNAAYIVSLQYDICPSSENVEKIFNTFNLGISQDQLVEALDEYSGNRPDELASHISDLILEL